ncbi:Uncharacterised protein [Candidatus Gugararchaeum adminiculabundum]|nr:Uncharacterised protein [Candidatus Gugararchaeum adminiculabundum]
MGESAQKMPEQQIPFKEAQPKPREDTHLNFVPVMSRIPVALNLPTTVFFLFLKNQAGFTKEDAIHLTCDDNKLFIQAFIKLMENAPKQFASLVASGNQAATDIYIRATKETSIIEKYKA